MGLFLGVSILSIVEIIYFMAFREISDDPDSESIGSPVKSIGSLVKSIDSPMKSEMGSPVKSMDSLVKSKHSSIKSIKSNRSSISNDTTVADEVFKADDDKGSIRSGY